MLEEENIKADGSESKFVSLKFGRDDDNDDEHLMRKGDDEK